MISKDKENKIKVVFLGEYQTGKTSIVNRLVNNTYNESVISTFEPVQLTFHYNNCSFDIWDLGGQKRCRTLNRVFFKKCHVIFMVYSINDRRTFDEIQNYYYNEVINYCTSEPSIIV